MRASNYTPVDAVKKLHEELDKLFAGKTFSGQGKNKSLNIFDFEFPTDFGNDEDVDTVAAAAPFILVKAAGWSIDKMEEPEMVDMSLIICTYQTPIRNKEEGVRDKKSSRRSGFVQHHAGYWTAFPRLQHLWRLFQRVASH